MVQHGLGRDPIEGCVPTDPGGQELVWGRGQNDGQRGAHAKAASVSKAGTQAANERLRWNLQHAWPSKWTGAELKANANEIAIETIEFCHEGIVEMLASG